MTDYWFTQSDSSDKGHCFGCAKRLDFCGTKTIQNKQFGFNANPPFANTRVRTRASSRTFIILLNKVETNQFTNRYLLLKQKVSDQTSYETFNAPLYFNEQLIHLVYLFTLVCCALYSYVPMFSLKLQCLDNKI